MTSMNKVVIVTGGPRGIGRGCALALTQAGWSIALVGLLAPEMARTEAEIRALEREAMGLEADVSVFARAGRVAKAVIAGFGRIDFLLNNAGKGNPAGLAARMGARRQ